MTNVYLICRRLSAEHKIYLHILKLVSHSRTSFTCDNCINTKRTSIESKSINNIYSLITSQTDSFKDQLTTLSNQCANLIRDNQPGDSLLRNSIYNTITNLSDTIKSTTSKSCANIVKYMPSSPLYPTPSLSQSSNISNINQI